jgi:hypothetical protein
MRRSLNEIEVGLKKAAIGAKWPIGMAEDIGRAAAIISGSGGDGVAATLAGLQQDQAADLTIDGKVARCSGATLIASAVGGFDLLGAGIVDLVEFDLETDFTLLAAIAVVAQTDQGTGFEVQREAEKITARLGSQNVFQLSDGAEVSDELWDQVTQLVAKTFVPASKNSRLSGAGAGMTDND